MCYKKLTTNSTPLSLDVNEYVKYSHVPSHFTCSHQKSSLRSYRHSPYDIGLLISSENDVEQSSGELGVTELSKDSLKPNPEALLNGMETNNSYDNNRARRGGFIPADMYRKNICRHFIVGTCNRGSCCRFYHPGMIHRVVTPLHLRTQAQQSITPLMDIALQQRQINQAAQPSPPLCEDPPALFDNYEAQESGGLSSAPTSGPPSGALSNPTPENRGSFAVARTPPIPDGELSISCAMWANCASLVNLKPPERVEGLFHSAQTVAARERPCQAPNSLRYPPQADVVAGDRGKQESGALSIPSIFVLQEVDSLPGLSPCQRQREKLCG
ncbi:unnamed protein product [Phytomonas sp. Hart1]|nr:unnamed protein product [Phytomonas sp. Hart1]|eukprot:CCW68567.1 unnamed protein product [Phytomonas sp. isolate Hart1]